MKPTPGPLAPAVPTPEMYRSRLRVAYRQSKRLHDARMGRTPLPEQGRHVPPGRISEANGDF